VSCLLFFAAVAAGGIIVGESIRHAATDGQGPRLPPFSTDTGGQPADPGGLEPDPNRRGAEQEEVAPGPAPARPASTPFGRSVQTLQHQLQTGKGPWNRVTAHAEPAQATVYRGGVSIEEVYVHQQTGERIIRHIVVRDGKILHETFRSYAKFGRP
jgi:hypothetical protein